MVLSDKIAILRDGELQQYASPDETYRKPANTFVAGFIGNPRMNFVNGALSRSNGHTVLESPGATFTIEGEQARVVAGEGREVTTGIRPEHLVLGQPAPGAVVARVDLIELVGPVTYLDLSIGERSLRASVPGNSRYAIGQEVAVAFSPEDVHYFDRGSGRRIEG